MLRAARILHDFRERRKEVRWLFRSRLGFYTLLTTRVTLTISLILSIAAYRKSKSFLRRQGMQFFACFTGKSLDFSPLNHPRLLV